MCYSKADGGYRCMPPQNLLNAYRGTADDGYSPNTINGAFWLSKEKPLELSVLKEEAYAHRIGFDGLKLAAAEQEAKSLCIGFAGLKLTATEYEREVTHLGNMIAQYSDAQVEDFDVRLKEAQKLFFDYEAAASDLSIGYGEVERLARKVTDANLALGYEVRYRLRETMAEILSFGKPMTIDINGDPEYSSMLYSASKFFPNSWNQTLSSKINLDFDDDDESGSWFRPDLNEIRIATGTENFSSYSSMEAVRTARTLNYRQYETRVEMVHELSHKFESVEPLIGAVGNSFLERRALPNQGYYDRDGDRYERDHFASYYIGRNYNHKSHTEIFSMGMETTFLGTNGSLIGLALPRYEHASRVTIFRADIEHRNLTIGILAGIRPLFNQDAMGQPIQTVFGTYDPNEVIIRK
jgi:hypothetical protein